MCIYIYIYTHIIYNIYIIYIYICIYIYNVPITQSALASERKSVVVGSNPTQNNFELQTGHQTKHFLEKNEDIKSLCDS